MAMLLMLGFSFISICCCVAMKWSLRRANQKLREEGEVNGREAVLFTL
jgi:hypothetical protein